MNIFDKNISELKRMRQEGADLVQESLQTIKNKDSDIDAFLEVYDDVKDETDSEKPLTGIPVAIKDNILNKGKIVSAGSKMLENYVASYDSTVARKLKEAGACIVGRTNMDEFAMGSSTENSAFKITKNPNDLNRVPGGSSGGSAAAVASGMVPVAIGTDTGGSVRQPASFCGVVGFKPSYGAISRFGLIAMGSSLDQAGIFSKSVQDAEIVFEVLKGKDKYDATTVPDSFISKDFENKKVLGVPRSFLSSGVSKEVLDNFEESLDLMRGQGYEIVDIDLEYYKFALAAYYIIMPAEVSTNLARFDGLRYGLQVEGASYEEMFKKSRGAGFGAEVKRRILTGTFVLSSGYMDAYYYKAVAMRNLIKEELSKVFESVDAIVTPTSPEPAFEIGAKSDPLSMYAADIFTVPVNIAKLPAISVPSGKAGDLPLGIQFISNEFEDFKMFDIAKDFERAYE